MIALFNKKLTPEQMENIKKRLNDPDNFPTQDEYIQYAKQKFGASKKMALAFMYNIQDIATKAKFNIE